MKKFELTNDTKIVFGKKLFRIRALVSFGNVKKDELGGYVEKEENLSHAGNAWVYGDAEVYGNARVYGDDEVCGNARVYGNADYTCVKGFGTEYRNTTFYRQKDGSIGVKCGCFYGTIDEFREQVNKTRDGKIAKEYLMIADLMEYHFQKEEGVGDE